LDFGAGFYLTSSESQAVQWARIVAKRRKTGNAIVNKYTLSDEKFKDLKILHFETADFDWLDFVVKNRKGQLYENLYDVVIGPVANDTTLSVIDDYMDGKFTKAYAIERLLPQNLTDQYAFLTDKAISLLSFERSELQ
jgi:hypothetical protein